MYCKEDWELASQAFAAWWKKELDRAVLQVLSPRTGARDWRPWDCWSFLRCREKPEYAIEEFRRIASSTFFGGEAFPNLYLNFGPGALAAFMSGYLHFDATAQTAWFEQRLDWREIDRLAVKQENEWWNYVRQTAQLAVNRSKGDFIVGQTDIGGSADVLASLRSAESLLVDMLTDEERVCEALGRIDALWIDVYEELHAIISQSQSGSSAWMGLWCPGRWYPLQCDYSAMISPSMFRTYVVPSLEVHCRYLDHAIYHWDGPGQIRHLDALLEIPGLDGIQWVPGDGNPPCDSSCWFPLYERILDAGKLLVLQIIGDPWNIPKLAGALPHRGQLLFSTFCASEDEAHHLLRLMGR